MIIISALFCLPVLFLAYIVNIRTRYRFNPASLMAYIWMLFLNIAILVGPRSGFYPVDIEVILAVCIFLSIILISFYFAFGKTTLIKESNENEIDKDQLMRLSAFLLMFCVFSNIAYFAQVNRLIPITTLANNLWAWKNYVLIGKINESGIMYIGRNLALIGAVLSINTYYNKTKTSKLLLLLYILLAFLNPRRDPIIIKMIYVIAPFLVLYKNKGKIFKLILPLSIVFIALFSVLTEQLTFGERTVSDTIGLYTYGSYNSLQKAIDNGYPSNTSLFLGNTFYFVYMILKYISPSLTPPDIVLQSMGRDTTNVYTALIAPLIDANGNMFSFSLIVLLYGVYIGCVLAFFYKSYTKNKTKISSLILYCACYSCVIRSFYNPSFSLSDFLFALAYWGVAKIIENSKVSKIRIVKRIE